MKPRNIAALTLILGAAALVAAADYSTKAPVKYLEKNGTCPEKCFCAETSMDDMMEVICPTDETIDRIDNSPPQDVDPGEDVELLSADSDISKDPSARVVDDLPEEKPSQSPDSVAEISNIIPDTEDSSQEAEDAPIEFPNDKVAEEFKVSKKPVIVEDTEDDFSLKPDPEGEGFMLSDQPADGVDEEENVTEHEEIDAKKEEKPLYSDEVDQNLDAAPSQRPTEKATVEDKLVLTNEQDLEATPSSAPASKEEDLHLPTEVAAEEEKSEPSVAEVTASLSPLSKISAESTTESVSTLDEAARDLSSGEESAEVQPTVDEVPITFNDTEPTPAPGKPDPQIQTEDSGSTEDILVLEPEVTESSATDVPVMIINKKVDSVETNNLVMTPMEGEMNGKIQSEEPAATEAPQQSTTSWVILGLILAMFVGVLLYAAIKGRIENGQDAIPKIPSISSNVPEFAKNRKPSGEEGTEMKEMSKALLSTPSSPLESRVSRFIDEDCDEVKRFIPHEMDEILEQVVVESQDSPRTVNNAVEKPPRKFIHVPSEEQERSSPNSPTLVRTKVVDMSPQVPRVISNGNSSNPFGEE